MIRSSYWDEFHDSDDYLEHHGVLGQRQATDAKNTAKKESTPIH